MKIEIQKKKIEKKLKKKRTQEEKISLKVKNIKKKANILEGEGAYGRVPISLSIHQVTTLAINKDEKKDYPLDFSIEKRSIPLGNPRCYGCTLRQIKRCHLN
jgi:hypothetical protein